MTPPHIVGSAIMQKTPDGYVCTIPIYGFAYGFQLRKLGDTIELRVLDGPVAPGWELPGLDVP
jgi:hypothetical protein